MLNLILISCFACVFVRYIGTPFRIRLNAAEIHLGRIKPLDCEVCMAFWVAFFYGLNSGLLYALGFGSVCACLSLFIYRKLFL